MGLAFFATWLSVTVLLNRCTRRGVSGSLINAPTLADAESDVADAILTYTFTKLKNGPTTLQSLPRLQMIQRLEKLALLYAEVCETARESNYYLARQPLYILVFYRRLQTLFTQISIDVYHCCFDLLDKVDLIRNARFVKFPAREDIDDSIEAIYAVQDAYDVSASDLVTGGHASGNQQRQRLLRRMHITAQDCLVVAKRALARKDHYHALPWLLESLKLIETEGGAPSVDIVDVLELLPDALYAQNNIEWALHYAYLLKELADDDPEEVTDVDDQIDDYQRRLKRDRKPPFSLGDKLPPLRNDHSRKDPEREAYQLLCRGQTSSVQNEGEALCKLPAASILNAFYFSKPTRPGLKCYLKTDVALLKLAPLKAEQILRDPEIVLFRDVITEREAFEVVSAALPKLKEFPVSDGTDTKQEPYRMGRSAWLHDDEILAAQRLTKRVQLMTNLDTSNVETFTCKVVEYDVGGHYKPHVDYFDKKDKYVKHKGNRAATVTFFLEQPKGTMEIGGAMVFTELNLAVLPNSRDAIFHKNMRKNGELDYRSMHAHCPVSAGVKWLATKYIHEPRDPAGGQQRNRKS